jgi:hypothetical protein
LFGLALPPVEQDFLDHGGLGLLDGTGMDLDVDVWEGLDIPAPSDFGLPW